MANPYAYNVVTFAGAALIAQATAANHIVIVGAVSRATAASSDEDLAGKDASWYTGKSGIIEAVSASANVAKIVARFDPDGARQDAKSIAVTARLASQTDADAIVLAAKSDPDATSILPGSGDTLAYVRFPFNIYIQTSGSVQVTPGAAASMADLARFVSLHKAGDPTQGDAQTILGEKTFDGDARFDGSVIVRGGVLKADVLQPYSNGPIEIGNGLVPDTDGAFDLGSGDYGFRAAYTNEIVGNGTLDCAGKNNVTVISRNSSNDAQIAFLELNTATTDDPSILLETSDTDDNRATLYIRRANGRCEITASSDATLGTTSNPLDELHASTTYTGHLRSPGSSISVCSLEPYGSAPYIGTQALPFDTIQSLTYRGADYLPDGVVQSNVGKSDNRFAGVYADTLDGVLVHPTASDTDPPVGSIVMLEVADSTSVNIDVGDQLQGVAGRNLKSAVWDADAGVWGNRGSYLGGIYRALSGGSPSSTHKNYVLAIRVQ